MSKIDTKELRFIKKAQLKHGNTFNYTKVVFKDSHTKVSIICNIHGIFEQSPTNHLCGQGCPKCGKLSSNTTRSLGFKNFVDQSIIVHDKKYDYSKVNYKNNHTKIIIICLIHGEFNQTPQNHLLGKGCFTCAIQSIKNKLSKSTKEFIDQASVIHDNKYDYSKVVYSNSFDKVLIACKKHGLFSQQPVKHLCGQGCPTCNHLISKAEIKWLDSLSVPEEFRHKTIKINGKNYIVDAFDFNTNTIYEFYGDYWHGNPKKYDSQKMNLTVKKTFGSLYKKTVDRELALKNAKYNIVSIWESDFNKKE
jgi:hypothetical protein